MAGNIGVWIDHERALIAAQGQETVTVVQSGIDGHPRFAHGGGHPGGNSSQGGASERRVEERHRNALNKYYDEVVATLGHPNAVLIFGPGEAKQQLEERLGRSKSNRRPTVAVETSDKLTDAQVIAKVSKYFDAVNRRGLAP